MIVCGPAEDLETGLVGEKLLMVGALLARTRVTSRDAQVVLA